MSDDEELLYGLLGTQFNVDEDQDTENRRHKLKRKAIDDEVTDAKGRALRFHGAFTGGFNAGYFNSVGSKEGFTPQQYISQGKKGSKSFNQFKPEDFMDEEDFGEHGIAPKLLKTKAVFDDEDMRKYFKQSLGSNSIIGDSDILKDILIPQKLTVGMMLLRQMGYVASRGVGDPDSNENSEEIDKVDLKNIQKFDYEAEEIYQLIGQLNKFGLGYSGIQHERGNGRNVQDQEEVNFGYKSKRGIRGAAFGVGIEEDDDDNEDHFGGDSMAKYNFEIVDDDEKEMNFGWTAPRQITRSIMQPGSIVGFQLGKSCSQASRIIYEPPKPSRFYMPIFPVRREKENTQLSKTERPKLMPSEEGQSVFNLISPGDRKRLMDVGQERHMKKSHSRWGDASESKKEKEESQSINAYEGSFKTPESSIKLKKESRKSWSLISNLGTMFKSAGSSSETRDINNCLNSITKPENTDELETPTKVLAANQENYGFMTRKMVSWHPDKLLCKRFNIPDPYPGVNFCGVPDEETREYVTPGAAPSEISYMATPELLIDTKPPKIEPVDVERAQPLREDPIISLPIVEVKTTVLDVSEKPDIDLFRAVFADSDAEFSSSDEEQVEEPVEKPKEVEMPIVSSLEQALNAMIGGSSHPSNPPATSCKPPPASSKIYGPTMPPGFIPNAVAVNPSYSVVNQIISRNIKELPKSSTEDLYDYKEKSKVKKHKKEKKSKKKKSRKSKNHEASDD